MGITDNLAKCWVSYNYGTSFVKSWGIGIRDIKTSHGWNAAYCRKPSVSLSQNITHFLYVYLSYVYVTELQRVSRHNH